MCKKELKTEKAKSWDQIKKGDKFIVKGDCNGHNYPKNKVLTMKRNGEGCGSTMYDIACEKRGGNNLDLRDVYVFVPTPTVKTLKSELAVLDEQINEINHKIRFCEENELTEFNESEYEIFSALDILEGKSSRKEKARLLSKILKGKK